MTNDPLTFLPSFQSFNLLGEISQHLLQTKRDPDIPVPPRMHCDNFGDPLTFHLTPSSDQIYKLSNTLVYDQISAEPMII